ncbi:MAG: hypothetical protein LBI04_05515 [Treponema sp.]|jgi:hypothetical protein|nr:hypothetical protein [Treponema sp.]
MDVDIKFCQSAFKHNISEADIRWAIDTVKYDGYLENDEDAENKRLLIGFDRNAKPLEIYYNILDENTVPGISRNEVSEYSQTSARK